MANNTVINSGTGGDTIRDIDRAGVKTQVMLLDGGGTASESIVSPTNGLPISSINASTGPTAFSASDAVGGAPDGNGTPINAASTAGSIVSIAVPAGMESWTMQVTSFGTGAIYTEGSIDSTNGTDGNWVALKGRRTGTTVGVESVVYTIVSNGVYRGNVAAITYLRARLIGTGTPSIKFILSGGSGATFLNSGIPSGSSDIGTVHISPGVLPNTSVVNKSGTITTGGTAQTLAAANTARTGLTIQNISSGDLMITEDGTTTASLTAGYRLSPGGTAKVNTTKLIQVWGATTGQAFTATEF